MKKKLIIEVDGDSHFQPGAQERDKKREEYLREQGFDILRFGNQQTVEEPEMVLMAIGNHLNLYKD